MEIHSINYTPFDFDFVHKNFIKIQNWANWQTPPKTAWIVGPQIHKLAIFLSNGPI